MKTVYWHLILEIIDQNGKPYERELEKIHSSKIRYATPQQKWELLAKPANRLWGREGKDWRIIQSDNLFGCFAQCNFMPQALYIK